jgi:hypothetical protein
MGHIVLPPGRDDLRELTTPDGHDARVPFALDGRRSDLDGPLGYTYASLAVRVDGEPTGRPCTREDVLAVLREVRFSGWLGRPENGWLPVVCADGAGTVASGRRGVVGVGERLAERLGATVVADRVVADRQLLLAVWADGGEVGRYLSDPSHGLDDDTLPDPLGVEHAGDFAAACGRPDAADDLAEMLAEELDVESVIESERLAAVLRLLGLPVWLASAGSLPRDIPTGPRARDMTRLGAGTEGLVGLLYGRAARVVRRHRPPPPAVEDPPRGSTDIEPWMF